jgi:hypothetical protein
MSFTALLIMYLILLIESPKMASSKPKHIAIFSSIVYIKIVLD